MAKLKDVTIMLVIVGGFAFLGAFVVGRNFLDENGGFLRDPNVIPYNETETGKFLTNPSVLIDNGAKTTILLNVFLSINCGNASEMRIKTGAVTPWREWELYKTSLTIKLGQQNPYFPIYTVSIQFRNGSYTSIIVHDAIKYLGEKPDDMPK